MQISHATPADVPVLAQIEAASYPAAEAASEGALAARVAAFGDCFWLVRQEGEICAFVNGLVSDRSDLNDEMYDHPERHTPTGRWQMIFSVVSAPQHRGCGYAGAALQAAIDAAKARGQQGVVLTCKAALLPFYAHFGFVNEGLSTSTHGAAQWYQMRLSF